MYNFFSLCCNIDELTIFCRCIFFIHYYSYSFELSALIHAFYVIFVIEFKLSNLNKRI